MIQIATQNRDLSDIEITERIQNKLKIKVSAGHVAQTRRSNGITSLRKSRSEELAETLLAIANENPGLYDHQIGDLARQRLKRKISNVHVAYVLRKLGVPSTRFKQSVELNRVVMEFSRKMPNVTDNEIAKLVQAKLGRRVSNSHVSYVRRSATVPLETKSTILEDLNGMQTQQQNKNSKDLSSDIESNENVARSSGEDSMNPSDDEVAMTDESSTESESGESEIPGLNEVNAGDQPLPSLKRNDVEEDVDIQTQNEAECSNGVDNSTLMDVDSLRARISNRESNSKTATTSSGKAQLKPMDVPVSNKRTRFSPDVEV